MAGVMVVSREVVDAQVAAVKVGMAAMGVADILDIPCTRRRYCT